MLTIKKTTKNRYRESKKEVVALQNELSIIQKRIDIIEDKYLDGELTKEQYNRMLERYTKEASTIQQQVEMRENPNRGIKIKLISSMFPEKIEFDGKTYRTNSYNKVLDLIYQQTNELRGVEKKNGESFSTFSASVPRPAFEIIKVGKMWVKRKTRKTP
nr:hypothetical protein [Bacteroides intestinalis]